MIIQIGLKFVKDKKSWNGIDSSRHFKLYLRSKKLCQKRYFSGF